MQNDQLDPWAEGKRGMKRGAIWTVIILAGAWLIVAQLGIAL